MNLYPALTSHMGIWNYYIVKMKMKDIVKEVGFASEVYDDKTLDDAIQRSLNESRVKKEIVEYLARRDDRFFSSIVVAALGGNPKFYPVQITDDPQFAIFKDQGFDDSFGVLSFDGGQKYFALDGQHRLKAIKTLVAQEEDVPLVPDGFLDEEISVIMLVRRDEDDAAFLKSYRRIFSSLNRYAKPTDRDTNIIMDEDDWVAILTRRLITEFDFFSWKGTESPKIKTKGKNMRSGESYFTTLQTLYEMVEILLLTPTRRNEGYSQSRFKQFRPDEELLDRLYEELSLYWGALLEAVAELHKDPAQMREHNALNEEAQDSLLFWPIGQELFATIARLLMTRKLPDADYPTKDGVLEAIAPLASTDWELGKSWRYLLLVENPSNGKWNMRNEDRNSAIAVAQRIISWEVGLDPLNADEIDELYMEWFSMLLPRLAEQEAKDHWEEFFSS